MIAREVRRAKKQLLVGHVLPFAPEFAFAYAGDSRRPVWQAARSRNSNARFPIPQWLPDFYEPDKVGGPLLDLLIHDAHFILAVLRHAAGCRQPRSDARQGG